ncbi:ATP-binding protein [Streptomyces sp. NBC_01317]|uniref:ATP-binding protein n=1 Tax=Streptomyces sp. NBC_01317 TaxID=2903822 RepID=UPI002E105D7B|nr:ATP-binding protein [Streptomyces sp. NBC_01317]
MTPSPQDPLFWALILAVVLAGSGVLIRRYRRAARGAEERIRALHREIDIRDAEARHLAHTRVPTLLRGIWQGRDTDEVPAALHPALAGTPFLATHEAVLQQFREVTTQATGRAEDGAKAAVSTVTRSMQGLLNDTTNAIDAMLRRHHDPAVLADANDIDHASSQLVRRAQAVNVLTGSWPGRQRRDSPLLDVVRGGVSKIRDYDRVKITGEPAYGVVSGAVEPVVLAIAELLDNAARHSEPGSDVQVWFVQAHNGVSVMIDDSGVGLKPEAKEAAARLLSGEEEVRLTQLGSRPKFGFPVVGVLAKRYGFRVAVDQDSIYGGVRAGLFLPSELLVTVDTEEPRAQPHGRAAEEQRGAESTEKSDKKRGGKPGGTSAEKPVVKPAAKVAEKSAVRPDADKRTDRSEEAETSDDPGELLLRPDGLPQRRRRTTARALPEERSVPAPPVRTSRNVGAFARGVRNAQDRRTSESEREDD